MKFTENPPRQIQTKPEEVEVVEHAKKGWSEADIGFMVGDMMRLNDNDFFNKEPTAYAEKSSDTFKEIKQYFLDQGASYFEEMADLYNFYQRGHEPLIVRRDDPVKIVQLLNGKSIDISFDPEVAGDGGEKYANCSLWPYGAVSATTGIANAFLEGRNKSGPIVMVAGFKNNPDHMELTDLKDKMETLGTISRHSIKILSGSIKPDDLEFVAMRISAKFLDESEFTTAEREAFKAGKLQQIFRGFRFGK